MKELSEDLKNKVIEAGEYLENGDPLKDALNQYEIEEVIGWLAWFFENYDMQLEA